MSILNMSRVVPYSRIHNVDMFGAELAGYEADRAERDLLRLAADGVLTSQDDFYASKPFAEFRAASRAFWQAIYPGDAP